MMTESRSILKLIVAMYFLIDFLPNNVINWTTDAFALEESKQFMNGKVLRVLVLHVNKSNYWRKTDKLTNRNF